jgi:addiction module HigA family antidote
MIRQPAAVMAGLTGHEFGRSGSLKSQIRMDNDINTEFHPDYAVAPGEILKEELDFRKMSQADLADRTGLSRKTVNEIIQAKAPISPDTALRFERVFRQPARYWLNLERQYDEFRARAAEQLELRKHRQWLKCFPLRKMLALGWLVHRENDVEQVEELLKFFAIGSVDQWNVVWKDLQVAWRRSNKVKASVHAISAWLRQGEIKAGALELQSFDRADFRDVLPDIRRLTCNGNPDEFVPELIRLCAAVGVAVVFVPELPRMGVSGATYWLRDFPVIQLSLRYKSDDHLWFTFFHEAAHILLHGKKERFLEGNGLDGEKEDQADAFAMRTLVSKPDYQRLRSSVPFSAPRIREFAHSIGIAPGIIVGRLQHDRHLPFNRFNELKVRYRWSLA